MPEITQCPQCQRKLNVQEAQLGQTVQCPVCGAFFTAAVISTQRAPSPPPIPAEDRPPRRYDEPPPRPRYGDDLRRDYPPRRGYADPYAEPMPHRGVVILLLGLVGMLLSCIPVLGWVLGGIALAMAKTDLPLIDRGVMDRDGRGMTLGGQVCGTIALVINSIVALIVCSEVLHM